MKRGRRGAALFVPIVAGTLLFLTGCSTFDRDWKAAARSASDQPGIGGAWQGRWQSDAGHGGGKLRGILTKAGMVHYKARFEATFWGFFRARYTVMLAAAESPDSATIEGKEDLGWLAGGTYRYSGQVTRDQFDATYQSKHDRGTFTLARP